MEGLPKLIVGIVYEGVKAWSEERRTRFMDEHHEILTRLKDAMNASGEDYTDAAIDISWQDLKIFLEAYFNELKKHNNSK